MQRKNISKITNLTEQEKESLSNVGFSTTYIGEKLYSETYVKELQGIITYLLNELEYEHTGLKIMLKENFKEKNSKWYEIIKDI